SSNPRLNSQLTDGWSDVNWVVDPQIRRARWHRIRGDGGTGEGTKWRSWCWNELRPHLERRGHGVIAPELPCDDPKAGFDDYADAVIDAIGTAYDVVLVGHSLAGLTITVVAARRPVD